MYYFNHDVLFFSIHSNLCKGIIKFKVPSDDSDFETKWRNKLAAVVTRDHVVDANKRIKEIKEFWYISNILETNNIMFMTPIKLWFLEKFQN